MSPRFWNGGTRQGPLLVRTQRRSVLRHEGRWLFLALTVLGACVVVEPSGLKAGEVVALQVGLEGERSGAVTLVPLSESVVGVADSQAAGVRVGEPRHLWSKRFAERGPYGVQPVAAPFLPVGITLHPKQEKRKQDGNKEPTHINQKLTSSVGTHCGKPWDGFWGAVYFGYQLLLLSAIVFLPPVLLVERLTRGRPARRLNPGPRAPSPSAPKDPEAK